MKKLLFTLICALSVVVSLNAGNIIQSNSTKLSGKCGDNLTWILTDGVLTISGSGVMTDWSYSSRAPWYSYRENITSVSIGNSVTSIGDYAFKDCSGLTSVTIPNSVKSIGRVAFYHCSGLTSVTIPNSVTSIGKEAFSRCSSLTNVTIGNSVTRIGEKAFSNCYALTEINVATDNPYYCSADGVVFNKTKTTLVLYPGGKYGAYTIPNSVTSIGDHVFDNYRGLTGITIPNSVKSISEDAFGMCDALTEINVATDNPYYCSVDRVLFNKTKTTLVRYLDRKKGTYTIPNSVTSIGGYAFYYYGYDLTSVTIPNSVTSIGRGAFYNCSGLTSIEIPNSVTSIGSWAFSYCHHLTGVTIGNNVTSIEERAFIGCSGLKEVRYPKGLDLSFADIPSSTTLIAYDRNNPPQQQSTPPQPPLLVMQEGTLVFSDASANNRIDANEKCNVRFQIKNIGKAPALNCVAKVRFSGNADGLSAKTVNLPRIAAGQTYDVLIPISATMYTQNGKVTMSIEVTEPNGFGVAPFDITVLTKAYEPPYLQIVDYNITSSSGKVKKMEPFTLTFNLQNIKYGDAEQVKVKINLPNNVFVMDGLAEQSFAQIKSGETQTIQIVLAANNNYTDTNIPVTIDVKERFGKFAENKQLNIALNATVSSSVNIAAKDEPQQNRKEIQLALLSSDVDRDIPTTNNQNKNTFAVIIGNEIYDNVDAVPYAQNDARIFHQYCEKTLGIPAKNIREYSNATRGQIQGSLDWLKEISKAFNKPNFIIYYAGHGVPDEITKESYLLPKDGYANNLNTCYKLNDFYETLGAMPADKIIVFLDACFSGAKPSGETLNFGKRGIAIKADPGKPQGNTIVLAATTKDEPAYPYTDKQHGMFTYYLLKKMQSDVDITLGKLFEYIKEQVTQQSVLENNKMQVPQPVSSLNVADTWQSWKLK